VVAMLGAQSSQQATSKKAKGKVRAVCNPFGSSSAKKKREKSTLYKKHLKKKKKAFCHLGILEGPEEKERECGRSTGDQKILPCERKKNGTRSGGQL